MSQFENEMKYFEYNRTINPYVPLFPFSQGKIFDKIFYKFNCIFFLNRQIEVQKNYVEWILSNTSFCFFEQAQLCRIFFE